MKNISAALIACGLIAGCGLHVDDRSTDWTPQQKDEWIRKAREECKPNGHALDSSSGGYTVMREVLVCPDGTLRIVPMQKGA
jgi:hypothetical protein